MRSHLASVPAWKIAFNIGVLVKKFRLLSLFLHCLLCIDILVHAQRPAIVLKEQAKFKTSPCTLDGNSYFIPKCYFLDMPVDHSGKTTNQTFPYFVLCQQPARSSPTQTLFLQQGGPGSPGDALWSAPLLLDPVLRTGDWRYCIPDHRGTGNSNLLQCKDGSHIASLDQPYPSEDCYNDLMDEQRAFIENMSVRNAAMDLWVAINTLSPQKNSTYLYAVSYGTNLALKYLTFAPYENLAGAILDGVAPTLLGYNRFSEFQNLVAVQYLAECGFASPVCRDCMGPNVVETVDLIYQELRYGVNACANELYKHGHNVTQDVLKTILGQLTTDDGQNRDLIIPLLYRFSVCTKTDIQDLMYFFDSYAENGLPQGERRASRVVLPRYNLKLNRATDSPTNDDYYYENQASEEDQGSSWVTYYLLLASELWAPNLNIDPSQTELDHRNKALYAGVPENDLPSYFVPLYKLSPGESYLMPTLESTGLLFLHGELDPATVAVGARYSYLHASSPNKHLLFFPNAVHDALSNTYEDTNSSDDDVSVTCAGKVMAEFITNGTVKESLECIKNLGAPDYSGELDTTADLVRSAFKSNKVWGSCEDVILQSRATHIDLPLTGRKKSRRIQL